MGDYNLDFPGGVLNEGNRVAFGEQGAVAVLNVYSGWFAALIPFYSG